MARQEVDRLCNGLEMVVEVVDKYVDKACCWWINSSIYLIASSNMKHFDDQDAFILKMVERLEAMESKKTA
jgi:hypothetical protein